MPRKTWIQVKGSARSKGKGRGKSNVRPRSRSSSADVIGTIAAEPQLTDERTETEPHDSDHDTDVGSVAICSASASQNKNTKKLKVVCDLSLEEEQPMVEWLEAHPIICNKKLTSYKETIKKRERMLMEKAVVMI